MAEWCLVDVGRGRVFLRAASVSLSYTIRSDLTWSVTGKHVSDLSFPTGRHRLTVEWRVGGGGEISAREGYCPEGRCPGGQAENWRHLLFLIKPLKTARKKGTHRRIVI